MSFELPKLGYELNALEPHISQETMEYHYGKHHKAYVDNLNKLIENTEFADLSLEDIIRKASGGLFNNAAQHWNHSFYWECMSPNGGNAPTGALADAINARFGSFQAFVDEFTKTAMTTFGSGWAWLVKTSNGGVDLVSTSNAANPMTLDKHPLLTCDVWEHAYYVDYRNARAKYVEAFWNLVNWDFISDRFTQ